MDYLCDITPEVWMSGCLQGSWAGVIQMTTGQCHLDPRAFHA